MTLILMICWLGFRINSRQSKFFFFSAIPSWWIVLGIIADNLWIRADFFNEMDDRRDIQSVKLAWSFLHSDPKIWILSPLEGNSKGHKLKIHTHTWCPCSYKRIFLKVNFSKVLMVLFGKYFCNSLHVKHVLLFLKAKISKILSLPFLFSQKWNHYE